MIRICFQKNATAGLGAFLILCLAVMTVLAQSEYAKRTYDAAQGAAVLKKVIGPPDKTIDLFNKAEAITDFPYTRSASGNNAPSLAPERIIVLSKEFGDLTDSWGQADLEAVPATLPGEVVAAAKPGTLAIVKVSMRNMQFYPKTLKVKKGTVVEWKNDDVVPHTATSASFDSGSVGQGKSWRHTFTQAGQFSYACTFHPTMMGVVIVK